VLIVDICKKKIHL